MTSSAEQTPGILQLIEPLPSGGAEAVVRSLAVASVNCGRRMDVALLSQGDGPMPLASSLRAVGVEVHEIRCGRRRYFREVGAVRRVIEATRTSLLHTHVYHADLVGLLAAWRSHVPVIATVHGFTGGSRRNRVYETLDVHALRWFDAVICVSETVADRVLGAGVPQDRLHVIPNGLAPSEPRTREEARAALGVPDDGPVVGWVGRLSDEKAPERVLKILPDLAPAPHVAFVGDGPLRYALERSVEEQGRGDAVTFAGELAEAGTLMTAFDVLVLTSKTEGVPVVLLEAMTAGIPIVAFGVGGVPHMLDETAAWIVPPGDMRGLGQALREALADPSEAAARAARARDRFDRQFHADAWFSKVQAVYNVVLTQRRDGF